MLIFTGSIVRQVGVSGGRFDDLNQVFSAELNRYLIPANLNNGNAGYFIKSDIKILFIPAFYVYSKIQCKLFFM